MGKQEKPLYTLVTLEQFKSVLGIDDREDKLAGYCLALSQRERGAMRAAIGRGVKHP